MSQTRQDQVTTIQTWLGCGSINLFGKPLSGKDTQAHILSKLLSIPIIGGGDIIRNSAEGAALKEKTAQGHLAPQDEYLQLVIPYLSKEEFSGKPLLLNSLGRWFGEHEPILAAAETAQHPVKAVLYLHVEDEVVLERSQLLHATNREIRADDHPDAIPLRLEEFRNKTLPVIDYFMSKGLLIKIDGNQATEDVGSNIIESLFAFIQREK